MADRRMTKTEYKEYIGGPSWQKRRKEYLAVYKSCNRCELPRWLAELIYDQDLNVHHRSYANLGAELDDDLEALCRRCHEIETFCRSNLPEVKGHTCNFCWRKVFDPRAVLCEVCDESISKSPSEKLCEMIEFLDESAMPDADDESLRTILTWQYMVGFLHCWKGIDNVLDALAACEEKAKKKAK